VNPDAQAVGMRQRAIQGAALTALFGLLAWWTVYPGQWLHHLSFDLPLLLRGRIDVTNVVVVAMDEKSFLGRTAPPLPSGAMVMDRSNHVALLDRLAAAGAKAVVFDLLFDEPSADPDTDVALGSAMARFGKTVIAADMGFDDHTGYGRNEPPVFPIPTLATNARVGFAQAKTDFGSVLRLHYVSPGRTNLAWAAATLLGVKAGSPDEIRWINYYGPFHPLKTLYYYEVLDTNFISDSVLKSIVSGKVVFVGEGRPGHDQHSTPYTLWTKRKMSGVEIQATIFLNLWRGDWYRRLPWPLENLLVLLGGLLAGAGLTGRRPGRALAWSTLAALLVVVASIALMWTTRWWFSWMTLVALQLPVALVWSLYIHATRPALLRVSVPGRIDSEPPAQSEPDTVLETLKPKAPPRPPIPDHTLLRCVGQGSYGEVWLARNYLGGFHAVKIVRRKRFEAKEPFEREMRGVQKFMPISRAHPGWVPILHVGFDQTEDCFYYVMEAADDASGDAEITPETYQPRSLAGELTRRGTLTLTECRELGLELTSALHYLHRHGLIHRDIKPSNILYLHGSPRFADIGLVTDVALPGCDTSFVGTQGYLCPEGPGTPSADVYSLGKVLYTAMTGFEPARFPELPTAIIEEAHESGGLAFYEAVAQACESDRRRRYESAIAFHDALKALAHP
jgi:CHASE2 domain-containing sensor protein